jgi:hypothetical protein
MLKKIENYSVFDYFIAAHLTDAFLNIDHKSPDMVAFEEKLAQTGQFVYVADLIQLKMLYSSDECRKFFGVESGVVEPDYYYNNTHADDLDRHRLGRLKLLKTGYDLYNTQTGYRILSTNFKIKNSQGEYIDLLNQCYIFYSDIPIKTSYCLAVHTNVTETMKKLGGFHYYFGKNKTNFRYPDEKLLMTGNVFTKREFEILKCLRDGLDSQQIR